MDVRQFSHPKTSAGFKIFGGDALVVSTTAGVSAFVDCIHILRTATLGGRFPTGVLPTGEDVVCLGRNSIHDSAPDGLKTADLFVFSVVARI